MLALPRPYDLVPSGGMFPVLESIFLMETLVPIVLPRKYLSQLLAGTFLM